MRLPEAGGLCTFRNGQRAAAAMAGSFGYRTDTYARIAADWRSAAVFLQLMPFPKKDLICAHGFSCRHQIADGTGRQSLHPACAASARTALSLVKTVPPVVFSNSLIWLDLTPKFREQMNINIRFNHL